MTGGIVVVTSGFPRRSETFALNELVALDARGALAGIFATKPGDGAPLHPGAERLAGRVQVLPAGSPAEQAAALADRVRDRPVRGVHGYFAHDPADVAMRAADRLGVPYGFSVHARDARKAGRARLGARARRAACVIACNADAAAEVRRAGAQPRLVPHGVDAERFSPSPQPPGALRLLAVGRLVPKKGFEVLVDAVSQLTIPSTLRIVGEGPERERLAARIVAARLSHRVELAGPRTHDDLPSEYTRAHVVVVPSVRDGSGDRDGLPNVVLEAMASGRPVVASDVGAIASGVADADTGLLVPPGEPADLARALETLAADAALRERLGRRARARVERDFDLGRCTARLCDVLEDAYA